MGNGDGGKKLTSGVKMGMGNGKWLWREEVNEWRENGLGKWEMVMEERS